jgi:hypothetical protein
MSFLRFRLENRVLPSSFNNVSGIRWYNLQEFFIARAQSIMNSSLKVKVWINMCTPTSFVALLMRSERNAPKNGVPTFGFSFTMLQHTYRFWSRISEQRKRWPHCSTTLTLLNWLQLKFICFLNWNQHWRDGAIVMLPISLRTRRKSWIGFRKMANRCHKHIVTQGDYFEGSVA